MVRTVGICCHLIAALVIAYPAAARQRQVLTPADYATWESIGEFRLSSDARWAAWTITRVDADGELRIREIATESTRAVPHASRPAFSADGRRLAWWVGHSDAERERLQQAGLPVRGGVGALDLATGDSMTITGIADFAFSSDGAFIALHGYAGDGRGRDVIVRDLARGVNTVFGNVAAAEWQPAGSLLAMIIDAPAGAANGLRTYDPHTGVIRVLVSDTSSYTGLVWREDADDLAVLRVRTDTLHGDPTHVVLHWRDVRAPQPRMAMLDPASRRDFPERVRIVDHRPFRWSEDGSMLFFGTKEWTLLADTGSAAAVADSANGAATTSQADAGVEVWHAADVEIVPQREVNASFDRSRSRIAVWRPDDDRFVAVADSTVTDVTLSDGRFAIGVDPAPYARERMFGPEYRDLYAIDVLTGARTRFAEHVQFHYGVSPAGRYMLYVRDGDYWTYDTSTGRHTNITASIPVSFVNHDNDHAIEEKPPFGTGGWTANDSTVLLYDEYDIWEVRPDGSGAINLTNGAADRVRHRRIWLTPEDRVVDRSKPVYVALSGERSKRTGFGRILPGSGFERLLLVDALVSRLSKADSVDVYTYRREAFDDSPDMFVAGPRLDDARRVTSTNPFQDEYAWGRAEVIDFRNAAGDTLEAALLYPADWEPGRTYPMIVWIYEITSNTVHNYTVPSEYTPYNTTVFTQNGYFVLRPDIVYRARDPGVSAVEAIVPAVEKVISAGLVDRDRVGLIGHSWGGYQTAFAVTQTDLFSAAVAGAPLTDLISMYASVFWNTGDPNARIFEIDQARMQVPFWEDLDAYIRNSPLFSIREMDTPLLVAFGDDDGAVDWRQGIELYNAARRADRDMVLLVYEGESHSLARKPNQLDYHRRILQWFGHYLKGEPAAEWITRELAKPGT